MPGLISFFIFLKKDIKINVQNNDLFLNWKNFINLGYNYTNSIAVHKGKNDTVSLLHSGGTTGIPKNICISNGNINAIMEQEKVIFPMIGEKDVFLSILPLFHCFGLVVCICAPLALGSTAALISQFDASRFDKLIRKYKPTVLAGVPTLFETLISNPYMINSDMSFIKYVISGGDSMPAETNNKLNNFLLEHGCSASLMQGYGMTESTGPVCVGALGSNKLGSVGIPLPGNNIKIFDPNTYEEMDTGKIGEICLSGPTIMKCYLNNEEETNNILKIHKNGDKWIHSGDLGYIDEDGVIFYNQRLKRMLIVSGYNVYPNYIEDVITKNPYVKRCGVIGIQHPYKIQELKNILF